MKDTPDEKNVNGDQLQSESIIHKKDADIFNSVYQHATQFKEKNHKIIENYKVSNSRKPHIFDMETKKHQFKGLHFAILLGIVIMLIFIPTGVGGAESQPGNGTQQNIHVEAKNGIITDFSVDGIHHSPVEELCQPGYYKIVSTQGIFSIAKSNREYIIIFETPVGSDQTLNSKITCRNFGRIDDTPELTIQKDAFEITVNKAGQITQVPIVSTPSPSLTPTSTPTPLPSLTPTSTPTPSPTPKSTPLGGIASQDSIILYVIIIVVAIFGIVILYFKPWDLKIFFAVEIPPIQEGEEETYHVTLTTTSPFHSINCHIYLDGRTTGGITRSGMYSFKLNKLNAGKHEITITGLVKKLPFWGTVRVNLRKQFDVIPKTTVKSISSKGVINEIVVPEISRIVIPEMPKLQNEINVITYPQYFNQGETRNVSVLITNILEQPIIIGGKLLRVNESTLIEYPIDSSTKGFKKQEKELEYKTKTGKLLKLRFTISYTIK